MTGGRSGGERLKVGIIGGGAITQVAHLPVLKKLKMIEVPALCDIDLPRPGPWPIASASRTPSTTSRICSGSRRWTRW
jgi:predicted dehydrogenase